MFSSVVRAITETLFDDADEEAGAAAGTAFATTLARLSSSSSAAVPPPPPLSGRPGAGAPVVLDAELLLAQAERVAGADTAAAPHSAEWQEFQRPTAAAAAGGEDGDDDDDDDDEDEVDPFAPVLTSRTYNDDDLPATWSSSSDDDDGGGGDVAGSVAIRYIDDDDLLVRYEAERAQIEAQQACVFVCGPRGSGKTSLIEALEARMRQQNHSVSVVRKPNQSVVELRAPRLPQTTRDVLEKLGGGGGAASNLLHRTADGEAAAAAAAATLAHGVPEDGRVDLCRENGCEGGADAHVPRVAANLDKLAASNAPRFALQREIHRLCTAIMSVHEDRTRAHADFTIVETCPEEQDRVWLPMLYASGAMSALDAEVLGSVQSALRLCAGAARVYSGHPMFIYIDSGGDDETDAAKVLRHRLCERARRHSDTVAQRRAVAAAGGASGGANGALAAPPTGSTTTTAAATVTPGEPGNAAAAAATAQSHGRVVEPELVELHERVPSLDELRRQVGLYNEMFKGKGADSWCHKRPVLHFPAHCMQDVAANGADSAHVADLLAAIQTQLERKRRALLDALNGRYGVPLDAEARRAAQRLAGRSTVAGRHRRRHGKSRSDRRRSVRRGKERASDDIETGGGGGSGGGGDDDGDLSKTSSEDGSGYETSDGNGSGESDDTGSESANDLFGGGGSYSDDERLAADENIELPGGAMGEVDTAYRPDVANAATNGLLLSVGDGPQQNVKND